MNPQQDQGLLIELARSYKNIYFISLWVQNVLFPHRPIPTLPQSVTVLLYFSLHFLPHQSFFSLISLSNGGRKKGQYDKDCEDSHHVTRLNPLSYRDSSLNRSIKICLLRAWCLGRGRPYMASAILGSLSSQAKFVGWGVRLDNSTFKRTD